LKWLDFYDKIDKLIYMANTNVKVERRERDNSMALLHRFQKKVQESAILPTVRKKRYNNREDSKVKAKKGKIKRIKSGEKYEELKRLGKLVKKTKKTRR